ncbi:hypothetical protein SFUL_145 [Streptomyces microflavus DSM 40593]|uniref:Uncharacterized protein n=1 Tax=Streptomyces microflavus DSM 40593 TaxID=1303692 RepID=N0CJG4_STRMI|nr:hypothetical protein SFUL_145 [Streptomyces microflavus DSM 40593]
MLNAGRLGPSQLRVRTGRALAAEAHELDLRHEVPSGGCAARTGEAYQQVAAEGAVEGSEEDTAGAQLFQPRPKDPAD